MEKLLLMALVEWSSNGKDIMASIEFTLMIYSSHVPSWLLPVLQGPRGNSCTWVHNVNSRVHDCIFERFYSVPCLNWWALFNSVVPTICHRISCSQVHELPWSITGLVITTWAHCLSFWLHKNFLQNALLPA